MRKTHRGRFKPQNPEKYVGNLNEITYRSGWEFKVMADFDRSPAIESWNSEGVVIDYFDPVRGKNRRYFVDFVARIRDRHGVVRTWLIEIKPAKECVPPVRRKHMKDKTFQAEVATYLTNQAKWASARDFCARQGWVFKVFTENELWPDRKKATK